MSSALRPRGAATLALLALLALVLAPGPASHRATAAEREPEPLPELLTHVLGLDGRVRPERTVLYAVGVKGAVRADVEDFRTTVARTLRDPRGWSTGGRVLFLPVQRKAELRIWLAAPESVAAAHPVCSAAYSCRVERDVYINERRWQRGAGTFRDRPLGDYRQYVVNHEVGHWLGLEHRDCPHPDVPARVMQQQTIALDGCRSRVWPLPDEQRRALRHLTDAAGAVAD